MSYINMDHADWMQRQIDASWQLADKTGKPMTYGRNTPRQLSPFQRKVCDIVGITGNGIYNAPIAHHAINWKWGAGVSMTWRGELATWDSSALTALVFLCHIARIRCSIDPAGPHRMRLSFWQRAKDGGISERHPNLEEATASWRAAMDGHSLHWSEAGLIEVQP